MRDKTVQLHETERSKWQQHWDGRAPGGQAGGYSRNTSVLAEIFFSGVCLARGNPSSLEAAGLMPEKARIVEQNIGKYELLSGQGKASIIQINRLLSIASRGLTNNL